MNQQYDQNLWENVLESMSKIVEPRLVNRWLRPAKISAERADAITIIVPNKFYKDLIDKSYLSQIQNILKDEWGIEGNVYVRADESTAQKPKTRVKQEEQPVSNNISAVDAQFTFENFVACASNIIAHSAAVAVAEGNFSIYNPLYIYGDTGLGKTHLMYAVANRIRKNLPKMTVLCMNCDTFVDKFVNSVKTNSVDKLKMEYNSADLFMLDDIQFLKSKEKTLDFFFTIFNTVHMKRKQVIITSDESPQNIEMEERMRSRFAGGLQVKIESPSTEERAAILMQKASEYEIKLDNRLAIFLAENVAAKSVRELIGALKRVSLYASFHNVPMTEDLARKTLEDSGQLRKFNKYVSAQELMAVVSDMFSVKLPDMTSKKRIQHIVYARQVAMYLMKTKMGLSLKEIGSNFGGKDHSTVSYAVDKIVKQLKTDEYLADIIGKITIKVFE
ncbi:MAG: chromosomal replication initiator protein DnaA [Deferribacteraceae bacterium]|jgi:chromosomal replication initiator protein|nr:chromosomal replication initiator protein DnaA [Deferribacteraceae bacterium]